MKKFAKIIINCFLIVVLVFSLRKISSKMVAYNKDSNAYHNIRAVYNHYDEYKKRYDALKNDNDDYRFWINIENTNVDYPVVQGLDNDFYLTHNFNKDKSSAGTIFVDYRNNIDNDNNIVIYGHNMRDKTMFNGLVSFKDESFFSDNNKIIITDDNGTREYEVFSTYVTRGSEELVGVSFQSHEEFEKYLHDIKEKSLYSSDVQLTADDKIITLWTCSYEFKDARTVVNGRLIN